MQTSNLYIIIVLTKKNTTRMPHVYKNSDVFSIHSFIHTQKVWHCSQPAHWTTTRS